MLWQRIQQRVRLHIGVGHCTIGPSPDFHFYYNQLERPTKTKDQGILEIEIKDFLSRNFGQGIQGNQGILFI